MGERHRHTHTPQRERRRKRRGEREKRIERGEKVREGRGGGRTYANVDDHIAYACKSRKFLKTWNKNFKWRLV